MRNNFNSQDLQIMVLSSKRASEIKPKLIFWIQIIAWFLAVSSILYTIGIIALEKKKIESFAVSESGEVIKITPIDEQTMDKLLLSKNIK